MGGGRGVPTPPKKKAAPRKKAAPKKASDPIVGGWVLDFIAAAVGIGWLGTLVADVVNGPYQQPATVNYLMVGVTGTLFGFRVMTRDKKE